MEYLLVFLLVFNVLYSSRQKKYTSTLKIWTHGSPTYADSRLLAMTVRPRHPGVTARFLCSYRELTSIVFFSLILKAARASPSVTLPINSQFPPLALVNEPFHFQFAETTFTSTSLSQVSYTLDDAPTWLSLDGDARTFSGTPRSTDLGLVTFNVIAIDDTGSTTAPVSLIVEDTSPVEPPSNISGLLSNFGVLSASKSLSLSTNEAFRVVFGRDSFTGKHDLSYYATSADRSPLPSWVLFDSETLTFSGLTPSLIAIPQTFGVALIASTVEGYSNAFVTFNLVVNDHQLALEPYERNVTFRSGSHFSYTIQDDLRLDGRSIQNDELVSASAEVPDWLYFDSETMTLSGTSPPGTTSQDIFISVSDIYQDNAHGIIHLRRISAIFSGEIGVLEAVIGRPFKYTIGRSILTRRDVSVHVRFGSATPWLHFDAASLTLHGTAPSNASPQKIEAHLTATVSTSPPKSETQTFEIEVKKSERSLKADGTVISSRGSSDEATSTPAASSSSNQVAKSGQREMLSNGSIAAISVVCGLVLLFLAGLVLWWLRCKRQGRKLWISRPSWGTLHTGQRGAAYVSDDKDVEKRNLNTEEPTVNAPQVPRETLRLDDSIRSSAYYRPSCDTVNHSYDLAKSDTLQSTLAGQGLSAGVTKDNDIQKNSTSLENSTKISATKRVRKAVKMPKNRSSHISQRSSGLPVERRIAGLGHGRADHGSSSRTYGSLIRKQLEELGNVTSTSTLSSTGWQTTNRRSASRVWSATAESAVVKDGNKHTIRKVSNSNSDEAESSNPGRMPLTPRSSNSHAISRRRATARSQSSGIGVDIPGSSTFPIKQGTRSSVATSDDWGTADGSSSYYSSGEEAGERYVLDNDRENRVARVGISRAQDTGKAEYFASTSADVAGAAPGGEENTAQASISSSQSRKRRFKVSKQPRSASARRLEGGGSKDTDESNVGGSRAFL